MSESILSFLLACIIVELTPGPNMTYLAMLSSMHGRKAGFSMVAGVSVGLLVIGLAAAFGATIFVAGNAVVYQSLRWAGVLYMIWLAWESWHEARDSKGATEGFDMRYFGRGFIINILNPKAAIFYITVFPSFIAAEHSSLSRSIGMTVIYVGIATIIHAGIVFLGGSIRPLLEDRKKTRIIRRFFSVLLLGVAVWFAWSTHQRL